MAWIESKKKQSGVNPFTEEFFSCAFLNGEGFILPFTLNADYKITVVFYETSIQRDAAIIGNSADAIHSHLTENSNKWYSSSGTALVEIGNWTGNVVHTFINNNGNSHNELDGVEVSTYTPTTDSGIYYTLGCRGNGATMLPTNIALIGYIKSYKIESISTGNTIFELKPYKLRKNGSTLTEGLLDMVSGKLYTNSNVTVSNDY